MRNSTGVLPAADPVWRVGDEIMVEHEDETWHRGTVEDVFVGPVLGMPIYVVDGIGYYLRETRAVKS